MTAVLALTQPEIQCRGVGVAGDRILAGAVVHVPVVTGDHLIAEVEQLGRVAAHIIP